MGKKNSPYYDAAVLIFQLMAAALVIRLITYHFGYRAYVPFLDDLLAFLLNVLRLMNIWLEKLTSGFIPRVFP